jgi:hypothetical protein
LGKDSKSFYDGQTVHFATKHKKEAVLGPLLSSLGLNCVVVPIDTDEFGTFSGERERSGSIREVLRQKISEATKVVPTGRLFLASEGSFGPHPVFGFGQTDLESLLMIDHQLEVEIYAEHFTSQTNHSSIRLDTEIYPEGFLASVGFPSHGVIVHPMGLSAPMYKGLHDELSLRSALRECWKHIESSEFQGAERAVVVSTDMRADHNPSRQKVIYRAGEALVEKLKSLCPTCRVPGFAITQGVPGLPCEECGEPSAAPVRVVWECVKCFHYEERPRPDGLVMLPAKDCEFCNP